MGNASTYVSNTRAKEQSNQYSQLICMGFDESISLKAATIHPTNINAAITYIASQSSSQTSSANDNNGSKSIDWPLNFPVYITIGHEAHQTGFTLTKEMYLKWKVVDVLRLLIEKMTEISEMQYRLMTPDHDQTISSAKDYTYIARKSIHKDLMCQWLVKATVLQIANQFNHLQNALKNTRIPTLITIYRRWIVLKY
eukprot:517898_1